MGPVHKTRTFFRSEKFFPDFFAAEKPVPERATRHFLKKSRSRSKVHAG